MAKSILTGVNAIINDAFGLTGGRLKYHHKAQCQRFSKAPKTDFDAQNLIRDILERIEHNWYRGKSSSTENWRWKPNTKIDRKNTSQEVVLERWIVRTQEEDAWVNQVPVGSGLKGSGDRRRAIDLVHRCGNRSYEFIELKVNEGGGTPLFAAMEILQYGVLYMFYRKNAQTLAKDRPDNELLKAARIHLKVLAPRKYYDGYDLAWLERRIKQGLARHTAETGCGFTMDFTFEALSLIPSGAPDVWKARPSRQPKR